MNMDWASGALPCTGLNTILKNSKIALTSYRQAQKCSQLSKQLKTVKILGTYF